MDSSLQDLLAELESFGRDNDAQQKERSKKMLNLERATAHFISILIQSSHSKNLLEIGTSNGYSTIWLAWSAKQNDGHVISIERDKDKQALAHANLVRAELRDRVGLLLGNATELVATLSGPFDFVFFDADRISAPEQLRLLLRKLTPGALVLADNVLSHPDEIAGYLEAIKSESHFDHMIIPVGKGLSLAYKTS